MFTGTYTPKLDDKFRLTLPAKFREQLKGGVMIVNGQDHSLYVYPKQGFEKVLLAHTNPLVGDAAARAFSRMLSSSSEDADLDSAGRVVIGAKKRQYAGITKECVVIGNVDHLEIWDAQRWDEYEQAHQETFSEGVASSLPDLL